MTDILVVTCKGFVPKREFIDWESLVQHLKSNTNIDHTISLRAEQSNYERVKTLEDKLARIRELVS